MLHPTISLAAEERRQRRISSALMAKQIRRLLPKRAPAMPAAWAMAKKVFTSVRSALAKNVIKELKEFRIKATAVRVEKLDTSLRALGEGRSVTGGIHRRQSLEYYWSGQRVRDGHKQILLLKAETDRKGNLCRRAVIHSS
jgi:hypothetical protein